MKLKLDENGKVVVVEGKPVYVDDKGNDVVFDIVATHATITRLNGEARDHRIAKEAAETKLAAFKDITDPAAAVKAMQTVKDLGDAKLVDAGKVEEIRNAAITAVKAEYEPVVKECAALQKSLHDEKIGGAFARSSLIVGEKAKLAIPADMVQARFGHHFTLVDGKVQAKDAAGNPIYARSNPGILAEFDEALDIIVEQYPQKASILKGSGQSGNGSQGGQGGGGGGSGAKTWTRDQFNAADQATRMTKSKEGFKVVD